MPLTTRRIRTHQLPDQARPVVSHVKDHRRNVSRNSAGVRSAGLPFGALPSHHDRSKCCGASPNRTQVPPNAFTLRPSGTACQATFNEEMTLGYPEAFLLVATHGGVIHLSLTERSLGLPAKDGHGDVNQVARGAAESIARYRRCRTSGAPALPAPKLR
jgi:hypothetical protein